MRVKVFEKLKDGDKTRLASFEGTILAMKHGKGITGSMTVYNTVATVGVERVFPLHSPVLEKVDILQTPKNFSRSKLY